jgi:hypothetical protein
MQSRAMTEKPISWEGALSRYGNKEKIDLGIDVV